MSLTAIFFCGMVAGFCLGFFLLMANAILMYAKQNGKLAARAMVPLDEVTDYALWLLGEVVSLEERGYRIVAITEDDEKGFMFFVRGKGKFCPAKQEQE